MAKEEMMLTEQEAQLGQEVSSIESTAQALVIQTDDDCACAENIMRDTKALQKRIDEFMEPMRKASYDAYKAVMERKNAMLEPLKKVEKILKPKMARYYMDQEQKRRAEEERLRKLKEEESSRKLEEAVKAEEAGDTEAAEYALAEAEAYDSMIVKIDKPVTKANGIRKTRSWEIVGIDLKTLPVEFAGCLLRPADTDVIMKLIKATKGQISIPGVEYRETVNVSVIAS